MRPRESEPRTGRSTIDKWFERHEGTACLAGAGILKILIVVTTCTVYLKQIVTNLSRTRRTSG